MKIENVMSGNISNYSLNKYALRTLEVNTSTMDIVAKPMTFKMKTTCTYSNFKEISMNIIIVISITNEQNWPKKLIAFVLFLC